MPLILPVSDTLRDASGQVYVEWKIDQFQDLSCKADYFLQSASFLLGDAEWHFKMYPDGERKNKSVGWISLYLCKEGFSFELHVTYSIGIKKADGSTLKSYECTHLFSKKERVRGYKKFYLRSKFLKSADVLTADGNLVIFCNAYLSDALSMVVESDAQNSPFDGTCPMCGKDDVDTTTPNYIETLADDLKKLFLGRQETDFTMNVQNKTFEVHRSILSARSPVFRVMLEVDMAEKNSNSVEINDCDPDSFENFLIFLYSGNRDSVTASNALSLYATATKYQVNQLKEACSKCLAQEISMDSLCDVVLLATLHDESELLDVATQFFIDNANKIIPTPRWGSFMVEHTTLATELLTKLTNKYMK